MVDAPASQPVAAELAYAAIWRIWPDNVHWYQAVMAAGDLLAGVLLFFLLRELGRSELTVLIYLWSPLVIFETAHSAHVDGLVLPLIVGAWLARVRSRDGLTGFGTEFVRLTPIPAVIGTPMYLVHLVTVFCLLIFLPYTKFAPAVYRLLAMTHARSRGRALPEPQ